MESEGSECLMINALNEGCKEARVDGIDSGISRKPFSDQFSPSKRYGRRLSLVAHGLHAEVSVRKLSHGCCNWRPSVIDVLRSSICIRRTGFEPVCIPVKVEHQALEIANWIDEHFNAR